MKWNNSGPPDCFTSKWIGILLLVSVATACGSVTREPSSTALREVISHQQADSEPREVVKEFMTLVQAKENDKANALFLQPNIGENESPTRKKLVERGSRLDWVQVLQERRFVLKEVLSETKDETEANIRVSFGIPEMKAFRQDSLFFLRKKDGKWFILDIEFVFDEKEKVVKSFSSLKL